MMKEFHENYSQEITKHLKNLLELPKGAEFLATELHVHSPGSRNDYKFKGKCYNSIPLEEIAADLVRLNLLPKGFNWRKNADDEQEWRDWALSQIIVAHAYKTSTRILVVTDHDSTSCYTKIRDCAKSLRRRLGADYNLYVLPGVEITAHSNVHIIAIVDPNNYKLLEMYLSVLEYKKTMGKPATIDEIINEVTGNMGGIIYFPHVDQNNLESVDIKKAIFSNEKVLAVSFNNSRQMNKIKKILEIPQYKREAPLAFVQDSDAHSPDEIGKSPIWLRMSKPSFSGLIQALRDPDLRIACEPPELPTHPIILGMAFLDSPIGIKRNKWHYIKFSEHLNCLIGARGTGKSTIINWITAALEQNIAEGISREWFGGFGRVLIFARNSSDFYVIDVNPIIPKVRSVDGQRPSDISRWIEVSKIDSHGRISYVDSKYQKMGIFDLFKTESFKQTSVEELASNSRKLHDLFVNYLKFTEYGTEYNSTLPKIGHFLDKLHKIGYDIEYLSKAKFLSQLQHYYNEYLSVLNKVKSIEEKFAEKLNIVFKDKLEMKIVLNAEVQILREKIYNILEINLFNIREEVLHHLYETALKIFQPHGVQQGLIDLLALTEEQIRRKYFISPFIPTQAQIESGVQSIEIKDVIEKLRRSFTSKKTKKTLAEILRETPKLSLQMLHNVRYGQLSKEEVPIFRELNHLSLGQKCVAILTFIIEGSEYFGDNRPLIIDQPEDHLDNRYIYDYLVKSLRDCKKHRQIIFSTHNPNIPVCADAEQVLVLNSDGEQCWVEHCGSIDLKDNGREVVSEIQEIMEGGKEAFEVRKRKYGY